MTHTFSNYSFPLRENPMSEELALQRAMLEVGFREVEVDEEECEIAMTVYRMGMVDTKNAPTTFTASEFPK
jgi:hypothetical protein